MAADLMVPPSASVVRRDAFEQAGGFDEALSGYEDDEWKLAWIQRPRLFRLLIALNDRLPYRARFIRLPNVTLR